MNGACEWNLKVLLFFIGFITYEIASLIHHLPPILCHTPAHILDASGFFFAWRPLEFLSKRCPSVQEELGNGRLDKTHDLGLRNEAPISPHLPQALIWELLRKYICFGYYLDKVGQSRPRHISAPRTLGHQGRFGIKKRHF